MSAEPDVIDALLPPRSAEPGLAVSVVRGGEVVARRSTGLASLAHRVPIGPGTRFHVVSISRSVFRFERDAANAVTGLVVTMERLKNVRLRRARAVKGEAG